MSKLYFVRFQAGLWLNMDKLIPHLILMSVVLIEDKLLMALINLFKSQVPQLESVARRDALHYAKADDKLLIDISKASYITNNQGFGVKTINYTYSVIVNWEGITYKGTLVNKYYGGSCTGCDPVVHANQNQKVSYDYMLNRIDTLKFRTLEQNVSC